MKGNEENMIVRIAELEKEIESIPDLQTEQIRLNEEIASLRKIVIKFTAKNFDLEYIKGKLTNEKLELKATKSKLETDLAKLSEQNISLTDKVHNLS